MTADGRHAGALSSSLGLPQLRLDGEEEWTVDWTWPPTPDDFSGMYSEDFEFGLEPSGEEAQHDRSTTENPRHASPSASTPHHSGSSFSYARLHNDVSGALLNMECKICGDKASGYHYGVHACEGCKGFFRRTVRLNLTYKHCNLNCRVHKRSRNKCQFCRFRKCVLTGMSHTAIRFGRTPLAERERMIAEFHTAAGEPALESVNRQTLARHLYDSYLKHFPMTKSRARAILTGRDGEHTPLVIHDMKSLRVGHEVMKFKQPSVPGSAPPGELELSFFRRVQYRSAESVRRLTEFAKSIPGFTALELSDQITMLKYSALEVHFVHLGHLTNKDGALIAEGQVFMTREFLKSLRKPFCDIMEPKFEFLGRFNILELEDCDLALFMAAVILCGDRPGLVNSKAVEELQDEVLKALELQLKVLHPGSPQLFARLLQKMTDLRSLVAEHVRVIQTLNKNELEMCLHPLLQEIMTDLY
ncbi:peroxisome proliferator-activated receptor gamma-like [Trichomycterus rosablanca]|uniref:peroxisome proliferator-activated receptor gamma-like n=1 Tax=Trichomycterus rosablanca TaxID=2290929 RepID=UPI002F351C1F